jgi:hypothetical protein
VGNAARGLSSPSSVEGSVNGPGKRRRLDDEIPPLNFPHLPRSPSLPDPELLDTIISTYFSHVHPFIPMVHKNRLRRRLEKQEEKEKLEILLHAMTISTARFINDKRLTSITANPTPYRDWVVSTGMQGLSVENLQTLIIIAFTDVSCPTDVPCKLRSR